MVTYFTSSKKYVHPFIKKHGLPDVIWKFPCKTAEDAINGEIRIMNQFHDFLNDTRWLNRAIGNKVSTKGWSEKRVDEWKTPAIRQKRIAALSGKTKSTEHKRKIKAAQIELCSDPTYLARRTAAIKAAFAKPEVKKRKSYGARQITLEKAKAILIADGPASRIAKEFGVDGNTVRAIKSGNHWSAEFD